MAFSGTGSSTFVLKPSVFGNSQPSTSSGVFGQTAQQQPPPGGVFGQQNQQQQSQGPYGATSSLGGSTGTTGTSTSHPLFGAQQPQQTGGLFGSGASSQQPQQTSGLFGSTTHQQTGSLFGNNTSAQQPQQTGSLFGSSTNTQQPQQTGGLFGSTTSMQQPQQTGGLFGSTASTQQQPQQTGNLFGSNMALPGGGPFGIQSQQLQTTAPAFGSSSSIFGAKPQQPQQQQFVVAGTNVLLTKTVKFNDLPEDWRRELETLDSFIQSQIQISKDLHQRKLGEEPLKGYELIKSAHKDFVNCHTNIRHDLHFMRDLKAKVDRAVEDTIIATRIVDGFRNPQASGGYLKEHAGFPFEVFSRVTNEIAARLSWYKSTIEQIERKLTSTSQAQTPHSIAAALQAQHQTFLALASKTAALDAELQKIKALYTQLWRQKTGSMRDPFDELDKGAVVDIGLESLNVK
ncbi:hypothetical protein AX15_004112 [Amanita polypyramis BW_CC]|nr:hypothetical protein AX15_004112 [Amanita polypyramis BW_CC]